MAEKTFLKNDKKVTFDDTDPKNRYLIQRNRAQTVGFVDSPILKGRLYFEDPAEALNISEDKWG